jgi:superfamily II DNA or RNA helicase
MDGSYGSMLKGLLLLRARSGKREETFPALALVCTAHKTDSMSALRHQAERGGTESAMGDFYAAASESAALLPGRSGGWRRPQIGALGATLAHWSLASREPTLVSIPTGTGKTAVAMAAPFLMPVPPRRVLVLVPQRQLRHQLARQFSTQDQLRRLAVLPDTAGTPRVTEMTGRNGDWSALEEADVVVALPNSISPVHYPAEDQPPTHLFDLIVVDEAHHAPAHTWQAVLDYFPEARALLLTATPRRRDGKRVPGSLEYYYPLRRALEENLYHPITPILIEPPWPYDRKRSDAKIAARAAELLDSGEHRTSTLLIRGGTIERLHELRRIYESVGIEVTLLYSTLSDRSQASIIERLTAGQIRAVAVVGMLGEGFDLPSLRLAAYHDKHKSVPATVQLIGRLARVHPDFPQRSSLITMADADVFPELKGVIRQLYGEDPDWSEVLPGIIDAEVQKDQLDRRFVERFPVSVTEVDPTKLRPGKRAFVYEVPRDWEPPYLDALPPQFEEGAPFANGRVVYAGTDPDSRLLVIVVRYVSRPKWSSDPALADVLYELHVAAHRTAPRTDLPGLVLLNLDRDGLRQEFERILGLDGVGQLAGPERIGGYLDSQDRVSVSSVGMRSTNAAIRGLATYRNFMGSGVDRGLRNADMARSALGHVMFQLNTSVGAANAGGAIEKSKIWLSRYGPIRELSKWVDAVATQLWFPQVTDQGPLLPAIDRGCRLESWPKTRPLAAELYPGLLTSDVELWDLAGQRLGIIQDFDLYVNDDPTGTLQDVEFPDEKSLHVVGVLHHRADDREVCVWEARIDTDGHVITAHDLEIRRGYSESASLAALLEEHPPTVYFLDGTTVIGHLRYDSRTLTSAFDARKLEEINWNGVDITAETIRIAARKNRGRSVHERLAEYLRSRSRAGSGRWIMCNDGAGEIADYIVIEPLENGEVHLGLWHAKAAYGREPSVRVKDFQEVVAQALRSRRQFPSTTVWSELADRLTGRASPKAILDPGSDDPALLYEFLGITDDDEIIPWTRRYPAVRGTLGIVQPGLSASEFRTQLASDPVPQAAQSLQELFCVLADTALADGAELTLIVSS